MHPQIRRLIKAFVYIVASWDMMLAYLFPLAAMLCLMAVFNPSSLEEVKSKLTVFLAKPEHCRQSPYCRRKIQESLDDPDMILTGFPTFDLIYLRPYFVDHIDKIVVYVFNCSATKFLLSPILKLGGKSFHNEDLFWQYWRECSQLTAAALHSMIIGLVLGFTVSKSMLYFLLGLGTSFIESYVYVFDMIEMVLVTTSNSIF